MDMTVRVVCVILMLVTAIVLFDSVKVLIESNKGKKYNKMSKTPMQKPNIKIKSLLKASSFLVMVNHGPNLSEMEKEIPIIPYYKGKSCLLALDEEER